jgi:hypothetical protein
MGQLFQQCVGLPIQHTVALLDDTRRALASLFWRRFCRQKGRRSPKWSLLKGTWVPTSPGNALRSLLSAGNRSRHCPC